MSDTNQTSPDIPPDNEPQSARLKVMPLVKQTYATVFSNFGDMMRIMWVAMILYVGLYQIRMLWGADGGQINKLSMSGGTMNVHFSGGFWAIVETLLGFLIIAAVAVALLRYVLTRQVTSFPGFGIGKRELRYWGYEILYIVFIALVWMTPLAALTALDMGMTMAFGSTGAMFPILLAVAVVGWFIFIIVILVRLAFVFPALSVDREGGVYVRFVHAWKTAKGHTATIIAALFLALLPGAVVSSVIGTLLMEDVLGQMDKGSFAVLTVMGSLSFWFQFVISTVLVAHAYTTIEASPENAEALDEG